MKNRIYCVSSADVSPKTAPIPLNGSIVECLKQAAEIGYNAIEVHTRENVEFDIDRINKTVEETGVKIASLITGRLNTEAGKDLMNDDQQIVEDALNGMKKYIDVADKLHTSIVLGWVRGKIPAGDSREKYLSRLAGNLAILDEYIGNRNVTINVEVINRYEVNSFVTCAELKDFINHWGFKHVGIHLDTFHMNIEEDNMADAIKLAGKQLSYVHIADNQRHYPGTGTIDFKSVFDALDEVGYEGPVSIECLPIPDGKTAAIEGLKYIKQF